MKFTQKTVDALGLPPRKTEAIIFDDDLPGLGLRIRAGGTRTWVFQYKIGRQTKHITIGNTGVVTLAKARATAADLHARVRLGGDPSGEKAESRIRETTPWRRRLPPICSTRRRA